VTLVALGHFDTLVAHCQLLIELKAIHRFHVKLGYCRPKSLTTIGIMDLYTCMIKSLPFTQKCSFCRHKTSPAVPVGLTNQSTIFMLLSV